MLYGDAVIGGELDELEDSSGSHAAIIQEETRAPTSSRLVGIDIPISLFGFRMGQVAHLLFSEVVSSKTCAIPRRASFDDSRPEAPARTCAFRSQPAVLAAQLRATSITSVIATAKAFVRGTPSQSVPYPDTPTLSVATVRPAA